MQKKFFYRLQKAAFITLAVLLFCLLLILFVRDNAVETNFRGKDFFAEVQNVTRSEEADGSFCEFTFVLDEVTYDTNLLFYLSHQSAEVYMGDELIYRLQGSEQLPFIKTAGSKWVRIPVYREDAGKTVRLILMPSYEGKLKGEVDFYLGSSLAVYRNEFQKALPAIILSLTNILVGILLLAVTVYCRIVKQKISGILSLSLLGITMGLWQITHNDFSPFLLEGREIFLYYVSVTMMLVCMLPLVRSAGLREASPETPLLRWYLIVVSILASMQILLQLFGILDLREMFTLTHGCIILGAVLMIVSATLDKTKKNKGNVRNAWILAVGALGDLAMYYIRGSSSRLLLILSAVLCFTLLEGAGFLADYTKQSRLLAEKEVQLTNSRVMTSMSQIRSHFVFNILNAISGMCKYDPEKADETIVRFSRYLRNNINIMEDDRMLPFETELQHLEDYVALEQIRFGDRLNFVTNLEVVDFMIPPLILQPVVENAIKHGITKKPGGGTILLSTWEEDGRIMIGVDDDGLGFDTQQSADEKSVGLKNIRFRLHHLMGGTLTIKSEIGKGTKVMISIPGKEIGDESDLCG